MLVENRNCGNKQTKRLIRELEIGKNKPKEIKGKRIRTKVEINEIRKIGRHH